MKASHSISLQLFGTLAFLVGAWFFTERFEGCAAKVPPPPAASCWAGARAVTTASLAAALARGADSRLLLRDDAVAAVVALDGALVIFLPESEHRPPADAITDALSPLPFEVRAALWDRTALVLWLGRGVGQKPDPTPLPSWNGPLRLDLVHDDLTADGCLVRTPLAPDAAHHVNNEHLGKIEKKAVAAEKLLVDAFGHTAERPFTDEEVATRRAHGWHLMHTSGIWAQRENTAPPAALIILVILFAFFWRAAADGKETIAEINLAALDRDGALIVPAKKGEGYRLLSHGLLHRGLEHLLNNSLSLWLGCYLLEPPLGTARTLLVFLAGVIAGGWVRLRLPRPGHLVGASGGAFAIQGAALALVLLPGPWVPVLEQHSFFIMLGVMVGAGLLLSLLPGISLLAHLGGATVGGLLAVTGLITLGRPPLDGGAEPNWVGYIAWALAGSALVVWVGAGIWVRHLSSVSDKALTKK